MVCSFSCFIHVEVEALSVDLNYMLLLLVEPIFNHSNRYFGDEFKADKLIAGWECADIVAFPTAELFNGMILAMYSIFLRIRKGMQYHGVATCIGG